MIAPARLDIGWRDLMVALVSAIRPGASNSYEGQVEGILFPPNEGLVVLSVRSGFDLLLGVLGFPEGSEILVSRVTIHDMARIIQAHGLVPVPVDIDMASLAIRRDALRDARTDRTRAVLVAQLFGSRSPLGDVSEFARKNGLVLIEDCAQAFDGTRYTGAPGADVAMFSFGPIKTHTCLGGGLMRVTNPSLLAAMRRRHQQLPRQPENQFARRVLKYMGLKLALAPWLYRGLVGAMGGRHQDALKAAARGFSGPAFFQQIRRRPSRGLLQTMAWRLGRSAEEGIEARRIRAEAFAAKVAHIPRPGHAATYHTHWVFPICVVDPDATARRVLRFGFDVTRGTTSLTVLHRSDDGPSPPSNAASRVMERVLFLPLSPRLSCSALERLVRALEGEPPPSGLVDLGAGERERETIPTGEHLERSG